MYYKVELKREKGGRLERNFRQKGKAAPEAKVAVPGSKSS